MKNKTTQKELNNKLWTAVYKLDNDTANELIKLGADINCKNEDGYTWLTNKINDIALLSNQFPNYLDAQKEFALAKFLVEKGANINAKNIDKETIIHKLATINDENLEKVNNGKVELSKFFEKVVEVGGKINASDITGKTPLHIAANNGGAFITELLIKNKATINIQDIEGNTPLYLAVKNGQVGVAEKLFDKGSLNIKNKSGQTLFHMAALGGKIEALNFLTEKFKNYAEYINLTDSNGKTAMHLAAENGNIEMIKALTKHKVDINARDKDGNTPLHLAAIQNNTETVQALISSGADYQKLNKLQQSPLQFLINNSSNIINYKPTNKEIQNLFNDCNLIARSAAIENEANFLHRIKVEGNYSNVERKGNRGKSTTLLVPDINIKLYDQQKGLSGLLHNVSDSLIRVYTFQDSSTGSNNEEFGSKRENINNRKSRFVATLSKEDFINQYKDYRNNSNSNHYVCDYNEILSNVSAKSIVGISLNKKDTDKVNALESKYYLSEKYGYDLPMFIISDGKLELWNPNLKEIKLLLKQTATETALKSGFIIDKNGEIEILNKNEVTTKEVVEFLTENTENTKKVPILMDKLLETVNNRLKNDDLPTIKKLDDYIIHKEDIKNFIKLLEHEQSLENKNYKIKTNEEVDKISQGMIASMQIKRPKKEILIEKYPQLKDYKSVAEILLDSQPMEKEIMKIKDQLNVNNAKQFFKQPVLQQLQTISRSSGISR